MILVYATCKNESEAKDISKKLIGKRLIACSNYFPVKSIYKWNGRIVEDNEYMILLKTLNKNFEIIQREIEKMHSYEVPCIERIDARANKKCEDWLNKEVR